MVILFKEKILAAIGGAKILSVSFAEIPPEERRLSFEERTGLASRLNLDFLYRITRPSELELADMAGFAQYLVNNQEETSIQSLLRAQEIDPKRIKNVFHGSASLER